MDIELGKEQRERSISLIKRYFDEEREEEIGDLAAGLLLDFVIERIGVYIYNQGLADAKKWFEKKLEELDIDYSMLVKEAPLDR